MPGSFIAEAVIDHSALLLTPSIRAVSDVDVRVEPQPFTRSDSPSIFYVVAAAEFRDFEEALDDDPTVEEWRTTVEFPDSRVYQVYPDPAAKLTTAKIADLGIQVLSLEGAARGWRLRLQAPDKETLGAYWQYCREEGVHFDLEKVYRSGPQSTVAARRDIEARLTDRQLEVARTATRMGYYDSDGASAEAVAAELGISRSTLSTHLRRIIEKVFDQVFGQE